MTRIAAISLCAAMVFTGVANAKDSVEIAQAKASIASQLKDPGSAQFTKVIYVPPTGKAKVGIACGWVNAKNSYGGYVGFRPFYASGNYAEIRDDSPDGSLNNHGIFDIMWNACSPFKDERHGDVLVELPRINPAAKCDQRYSDKPEKAASCVESESADKVWLESYKTNSSIAYTCALAARKYGSYSMAKSCIKEQEATIVFSRGAGI